MKFSVRMFRQIVLRVLYLERENGNAPYHLPEKRVVSIEKQMKRYIFSGTCNCGQMVQKFPGIPVKARKRNTSKGITFFPKTFHRDEPFHFNSLRNYRKFHSNGKRSWPNSFSYFPNREKTAVNQPSPKNVFFFLKKIFKVRRKKYIILKLRK